jgi:fumarate reductase subunit D
MISPEIGRVWFQVAVFIIVASGILALVTQPDTAEHVISIASLFVGILFIVVLVILIRRSQH